MSIKARYAYTVGFCPVLSFIIIFSLFGWDGFSIFITVVTFILSLFWIAGARGALYHD